MVNILCICKEFIELAKKSTEIPIGKLTNYIQRAFPEEQTQMEKNMKTLTSHNTESEP